ncbi:alpha/beta hydrolase [Rickettsiales endosymbiont of Peranema trichophorum]|uniref:alpha/beta hydrolase n=1 Tax=Rickettsiales endosymbiont of Peranema trichophorum TaxID=2486577 RepID=UPI001F5CBB7D|nr:alpha/beta hydrolase [Rickettsiales endosymbiont of Peranema trichophorum]
MNKTVIKEVMLTGQAGRLEGKYYQSSETTAPVAIILHPHPLHGGTMNNKVVYNIFHTLAKNNFSVLRFNFRGVGRSHGTFDSGLGELIDAAAALDWMQSQHPQASSHWIVGFSFGAWIALQLLMRRPELDGFITIAPPVNSYDFNFLSPCPVRGLIIQGTKDAVVPEDAVYELYEKLDKQREASIDYMLINNAGHSFNKEIDKLNQIVEDYVKINALSGSKPKKMKRDRRRRQLPDIESMMSTGS